MMREPTKKTGIHLAVRCQVLGCEAPLEKAYFKRCKVCPEHSRHPTMVMEGQCVRFCCLCRRFHDVNDFEGEKRSCRKMLSIHNARRRKPKPTVTVREVVSSIHPGPATSNIVSTSNHALSSPTAGRALQLTRPVHLIPASPFQLAAAVHASSHAPQVATVPAPSQLQPTHSEVQPQGQANSMAATDLTPLVLPSMNSAELNDVLDWLPDIIDDIVAMPAAHPMLPPPKEQWNDSEAPHLSQALAATQMQSLVQSVDCRPGMSALMAPAVSPQGFAPPNSLLPGNMLPGIVLSTAPVMQNVPGQPCSSTVGTPTSPWYAQLSWPPLPASHPTTFQPTLLLPGTGHPVAWQPLVSPPTQEGLSQAPNITVIFNGAMIKLPERLQQEVRDLLASEMGLELHA